MDNFIFLYQLVAVTSALFVSRCSIHNSLVLLIGCQKFPSLYIVNMHNYVEIERRDKVTYQQAPPPAKELLSRQESFFLHYDDTKGEGGVFVLENMSNMVKPCIPLGHDHFVKMFTDSSLNKRKDNIVISTVKMFRRLYIFYQLENATK